MLKSTQMEGEPHKLRLTAFGSQRSYLARNVQESNACLVGNIEREA